MMQKRIETLQGCIDTIHLYRVVLYGEEGLNIDMMQYRIYWN